MKKKVLVLYSWILVSVMAQVVLYLAIDKLYLGSRSNLAETVKVVNVDSIGKNEGVEEAPETSIALPANAANVKISPDGSYISYLLDKKLYIVDVVSKETKKIIDNYFVNGNNAQNKVEADITCIQWIPGRNTLMYGLTSTPGNPGKVQMFTYDVETGNEHVGVTFSEYYVPRGGELTDIVISPLTQVYYAKIKINQTQERLFRVNLMDEMSPSITLNTNAVTRIGYYSEDLLYDDGSGKLFVKSAFKNPTQIQIGFNFALLNVIGADQGGKDIVYLGQVNGENKVEKIYYGILGTDVTTWQSIAVAKPLLREEILIKQGGATYGIDGEGGNVYDLQDGSIVAVKGKFVDVVNDHIAYMDNNQLKFKPIKKKE